MKERGEEGRGSAESGIRKVCRKVECGIQRLLERMLPGVSEEGLGRPGSVPAPGESSGEGALHHVPGPGVCPLQVGPSAPVGQLLFPPTTVAPERRPGDRGRLLRAVEARWNEVRSRDLRDMPEFTGKRPRDTDSPNT